jgi:Raf kinase inhibitor-like YbhB/YbcL family protein
MMSNDPFNRLPVAASFIVTSDDMTDGQPLAKPQYSSIFGVPAGEDVSPALSWSGAPQGTLSYAITMYDPDAPTGSGFWHWAVAGIPATVTSLPAGAGEPDGANLPQGSFQLPNDARQPRYIGAAPPAGHGRHRYFFVVHALGVADIGVPTDATPAFLGFTMAGCILGRAVLVPWGEIEG